MKNILLSLFLVLVFFGQADATIWYVRTDGGTSTQCTGTTDAAYDGAGTGEACAFNHLNWVLPPQGYGSPVPITLLQAGDTVIVDGVDHVNGGKASYMFGSEAPNNSSCNIWYSCDMYAIPSGVDAAHPTRILGKGYENGTDTPELWGSKGSGRIFKIQNNNYVEINNFEITDHSECQYGSNPQGARCLAQPASTGYLYEGIGILGTSNSYITLKNINIHGVYRAPILAAANTEMWHFRFENVKAVGGGWVGIDLVDGWSKGMTVMKNVYVDYNSCGERYPELGPRYCNGDYESGVADGIALRGDDFVIDGVSSHHHVRDDFDAVYGVNSMLLLNSDFGGATGVTFKVASYHSFIALNNKFVKNPRWMEKQSFEGNGLICQSYGSFYPFIMSTSQKQYFYNNSFFHEGDILVELGGRGVTLPPVCDGTETVYSRNNLFIFAPEICGAGGQHLYYNAGTYDWNPAAPCKSIIFNDDYSLIANYNGTSPTGYCSATDHSSTFPANPHSVCADAKLNYTYAPTATGFKGWAFDLSLDVTSPGKGMATKTPPEYNTPIETLLQNDYPLPAEYAGKTIIQLLATDRLGVSRGDGAWDVGCDVIGDSKAHNSGSGASYGEM